MTDHAELIRSALADRYPIERELGRGGMAMVYLAEDPRHHRRVAVKVLRPELASVLGPDRFLREIEIAGRFSHPHILPLYDSGVAAGYLYYVMPFVEGESLRGRLDRERQLPVEAAVQLAREVADALAYAHERGVVHRDIKPENILLSGGHAVVADFGVARAIDAAGAERLTGTGFSVGTPAYMSPEQWASEPVDGRSDLFSLGCVLYESLAGELPFTGATAQVIAARRMLEKPRSLRAIRPGVPESVEHAVERVLAPLAADRHESAAHFAAALTGGIPPAIPSAGGRRRRISIAAAVGAVLLASAAAYWALRPPPAPAPDPNLVAVAPFNVLDPALALWREGLVDQLAKNLDGAGELRTVSPSTYLRGHPDRADRTTAEALGQRTGAGVVIYGDLITESGDSVRVRATVLEADAGAAPPEVEVSGPAERLGALTDSLSVRLLGALGERRPAMAPRQVLLGRHPLPALKAFLQGEQEYRRRDYPAALGQYAKAIAADSGFALAYRRMGLALGFHPEAAEEYRPHEEYVVRAAQLNHGLSPRDSLLIAGDSLILALTDEQQDQLGAWNRLREVREETVRRFPGDPEAWLQLGEFRSHNGHPFFGPATALAAFERAIALDSGFAPAYEHVVADALRSGRQEHAVVLLRAFLRHVPPESRRDSDPPIAYEAAILDERGHPTADLSALDSASGTVLFRMIVEDFANWPDSLETAVRLARRLATTQIDLRGAPPWVADSEARQSLLGWALAARGRLAEAYAAYPALPPVDGPIVFTEYPMLALLGAVPPESAAISFGRLLESGDMSASRGLLWWLSRGEASALRRFASQRDSATRAGSETLRRRNGELAQEARAYLSLLAGDSAAALNQLQQISDSVCVFGFRAACARRALVAAPLLADRGSQREAATLLDRHFYWGLSPHQLLGILERSRLAESLGERDRAIQGYQFVLDAWRHADPSLQVHVSEARRALQRLAGER